MPLLLNVLRNADGPDFQRLRVKAMECAGLIGELRMPLGLHLQTIHLSLAIAVGPDVFQQDSKTLVELLMRIQRRFFISCVILLFICRREPVRP
jgi:hypothetical protein